MNASPEIHKKKAHSPPHREAGNAVTLTLLGLAVAILAGVVVLYWIGRSTPEQIVPLTPSKDVATTTTTVDPRAGWQTYTDSLYEFTIQFPPGWLVATGTVGQDPVITIAPGEQNASSTDGYHTKTIRISVYPLGHVLSDDEQQKDLVQSTVILTVPQASAKDYVLGSKRPWATIGSFDQQPSAWSEAGYLYVRAHVEDETFSYLRGENEITKDEFDPTTGDRVVRQGYVDPTVRTIEEEILRSFAFVKNEQVPQEHSTGDLIQVNQPKEGDRVKSPLVVQGRARGNWYFEGSFPVRLETAAGEVLAEVPGSAQGEWMTTDFVPFELSLVYGTTTATSGVLILQNDNPSGLIEQAKEIRIPVLFSAD